MNYVLRELSAFIKLTDNSAFVLLVFKRVHDQQGRGRGKSCLTSVNRVSVYGYEIPLSSRPS